MKNLDELNEFIENEAEEYAKLMLNGTEDESLKNQIKQDYFNGIVSKAAEEYWSYRFYNFYDDETN